MTHQISVASAGITVPPAFYDTDTPVIEVRCSCGDWSAQFADPVLLWDVLKAVGRHVIDGETSPQPGDDEPPGCAIPASFLPSGVGYCPAAAVAVRRVDRLGLIPVCAGHTDGQPAQGGAFAPMTPAQIGAALDRAAQEATDA